jgi:hypothetical protein
MPAHFDYPRLHLDQLENPDKLSKSEAKEFFVRFVGMADNRLAVLRNAFALCTGRPESDLDESPESLDLLWNWVTAAIATRSPNKEEITARENRITSWIQSLIGRGAAINENDERKLRNNFEIEHRELTADTITLAIDVGFYFAKILMRRFPDIKWWLASRKSEMGYNKPTLALISDMKNPPVCDPYDVVKHGFALYARGEKNENHLLKFFRGYEQSRVAFDLHGDKNQKYL